MEMVSVIVPVYNAEGSLRRCAESILAQDRPELELILVDDGSRDGSWDLMRSLAGQDARVRAIRKENGGVSSARNRALEEASGRYVMFADADDWLPMDAVKLLVRELEESGADLAVGDFYRVMDGNVSRKGAIANGGVLSRREYADAMMLSPADLYYGVLWNKIYRRDLIERFSLRMDESISYSEDMIFNLEYLRHVDAVAVLKTPVYYYEFTRGSLVDRNTNLAATVRMKKSVIGYYDEFFRETFDPLEYQERLPVIYSYLFAVSRDSLALPFLPGTKKLSAEAEDALIRDLPDSGPETALLEIRLLERYLDSISKKHGIGQDEAKVLYLLRKLGRPCRPGELAGFPGLTRSAVTLALARLVMRGFAVRDNSGGAARYGFDCARLEEDLSRLERDFDAVRFEGLTEEEIAEYRRCSDAAAANIRRHLLAEVRAEETRSDGNERT